MNKFKDNTNRTIRPKNAGVLIVIDKHNDKYRILMGIRNQKHKFMPGKLVFPGGKTELSDGRIQVKQDLNSYVYEKLTKKVRANELTKNKIKSTAMAAIRETFEETGWLIGKKISNKLKSRSSDWQEYLDHGIRPPLENLNFFARAITPPGLPKRFDARFFTIKSDFVINRLEKFNNNKELLEIKWVYLDEAKKSKLALITRIIIEKLEEELYKNEKYPFDFKRPANFFYRKKGSFVNEKLC